MSKKRVYWIDYAKGMAIICVVIGHAIESCIAGNLLSNNTEKVFDNIYNLIYAFHMPLFIYLSGYLYALTTLRDKTKVSKSVINFSVLYVGYSVLYLCLRLLVANQMNSEVRWWHLVTIPFKPIGPYWYLWVLIIYYIFFEFCYLKNIKQNYLILGLVCINIIVNIIANILYIEIPSQIYQLFYYGIFFFLGIKNENRIQKQFSNASLISIGGVILLAFAVIKTYSKIYMKNVPVVNGIIGYLFIILIIEMSKKIKTKNIFLEYIGKNTLPIYLLHLFFVTFTRIACRIFSINGIVCFIIMVLLGIAGPLSIMWSSKKLKLYKLLFKPVELLLKNGKE